MEFDDFIVGDVPNSLESLLIEAVESAKPFEFDAQLLETIEKEHGQEQARIRAPLIRAILSGLPVGNLPLDEETGGAPPDVERKSRNDQLRGTRPVKLSPFGVCIRPKQVFTTCEERAAAARIPVSGKLDLSNARSVEGGSLPTVRLSYCEFVEPIDVSEARLSAFSLEGSRFSALIASGTNFEGSLELKWCGPLEGSSKQDCKFPFSGLWVFSQFNPQTKGPALSTAKPEERRKSKDEEKQNEAWSPPEAISDQASLSTCILQLQRTHIEGRLDLSFSDFVRGEEQFSPETGSKLQLKSAVNLKSAYIRDDLIAAQSVIVGSISLVGIAAEEDVWFVGCRLFAYGNDVAINLQLANISGLFSIRECEYEQTAPASARKDFRIPLLIGGIAGIGLNAQEVWLGTGVYSAGSIGFPKATIQQSITFGSYYSGNQNVDECASIHAAIDVSNVDVGRNLEINHTSGLIDTNLFESEFATKFLKHRFSPSFEIKAHGANIARHFTFSHSAAAIPHYNRNPDKPAIDLWKATVKTGIRIDRDSSLVGGLRLEASEISRKVDIQCSDISLSDRAQGLRRSINLRGASVDGEIAVGRPSSDETYQKISLSGAIDLSQARVSGAIRLENARFEVPPREQSSQGQALVEDESNYVGRTRTLINLKDCKCEGELKIRGLQMDRIAPKDLKRQRFVDPFPALTRLQSGEPMRFSGLSFYSDIVVAEGMSNGKARTWLIDTSRQEVVAELEGTSPPVHKVNAELKSAGRFELQSEQVQLDYLSYFCNYVQGAEGPFTVINDSKIGGVTVAPPKLIGVEENPVVPENAEPDDEEADHVIRKARFEAAILYSNALFNTTMAINLDTGMVEMEDDDPIAADLEIKEIEGFWRSDRRHDQLTEQPFLSSISEEAQLEAKAILVAQSKDTKQAKADRRKIRRAEVLPDAPPHKGKARYFNYFGNLDKVTDAASRERADYATMIDLRGFSCGLLNDGAGSEWNLKDFAWLRAEGIKCSRVEATPVSRVKAEKTTSARRRRKNDAKERNAPLRDEGEATEAFEHAIAPRIGTAIGRLDWLRHQRRLRTTAEENHSERWWEELIFQKRFRWARNRDFVPQTYDEFATNYLRAGESEIGRGILKRKKDIESSIRFWSLFKRFFTVRGTASGLGKWIGGSLPFGFRLLLLSILLLTAGAYLQLRHPDILTAGLWVTGLGALALLVVLIPFIEATFTTFFRTGFDYGLSPRRALITFGVFIAIGWTGTQWARTGHPLDPTTQWETLVTDDGLDRRVALVLDVAYEPDSVDRRTSEFRNQGRAIYAEPTPCNLGVSSLLYAMDVFIPLIDLDQRKRCTIREASETDGPTYFWWRFAKTLYEILGWIVTSLLILTISGAMRRDIDR